MHGSFRPRLSAHRAAIVCTALLALAACDQAPDPSAPGATHAMPSRDALPDCDQVQAAFEGQLAGWTPAQGTGPWENAMRNSYGMDCSWISPQLQAESAFDIVQGAALMVRINVDPGALTAAELRQIGMVVDDPAVEEADGVLVYPGARLDFAAPLGMVAPEVLIHRVGVTVGKSGVMLVNETRETASITHRRAVDVALAVHRLIDP